MLFAFLGTAEAAPTATFQAVAAGDAFACALDTSGAVWCWGANGDGELGGTTDARYERIPKKLPLTGVKQIAAARHWAAAVTSDGAVWTWGRDGWGMRTGVPSEYVNKGAPTQVKGLDHVKEVALGELHGCALRDDGTVWCWGNDQNGRLGDASRFPETPTFGPSGGGPSPGITAPGVPVYTPPPTDPRPEPAYAPAPVPGIAHATAIAAFGDRTAAVVDGEVWLWGRAAARISAEWGEMGARAPTRDEIAPLKVEGLSGVDTLALAPYALICGTKESVTVVDRETATVPAIGHVRALSGNQAYIALTDDGSVRVWNGTHERGDGGKWADPPSTLPFKAKSVSMGREFAVAVDSQGAVWGWGAGWAGQLGPGTEPIGDSAYWYADRPVQIIGP